MFGIQYWQLNDVQKSLKSEEINLDSISVRIQLLERVASSSSASIKQERESKNGGQIERIEKVSGIRKLKLRKIKTSL